MISKHARESLYLWNVERLERPSGDTAVSTCRPSPASTSLWPGKYTPMLSMQGEGARFKLLQLIQKRNQIILRMSNPVSRCFLILWVRSIDGLLWRSLLFLQGRGTTVLRFLRRKAETSSNVWHLVSQATKGSMACSHSTPPCLPSR